MIKSKLSNRQKAFPRVLLNLAKRVKLGKTLNWLKYDWGVLKTREVNFTPPIMAATITEACNLRCPTCLYMLEDESYLSSGFMKVGDFRYELYSKKAWLSDVLFLSGGEPFLHPQLRELIDIGHSFGLKVKTSTNGILLFDRKIDLTKFDDMNISIDSWDYKSFNKYRGGSESDYKKLKRNLNYLCMDKDRVSYSLSFLLSRDNVSHIDDMLRFASYYYPHTVHFHNINPHGSDLQSITKDMDEFNYIKEVTKRGHYNFDIVISHIFDISSDEFWKAKCVQPWYYHCWNSKGLYSPCCHLPHTYNDEEELNRFREMTMESKMPQESCKYCQRRFLGKNYAIFSERKNKWMF